MTSPMVSVIMPAYNAAKTIQESLESVINQTYHNWELIVVDDGSKDSTAALVTSYEKRDARVRLLRLSKNSGLSNARNQGCVAAMGSMIAFLDSDDIWHKDKLNAQIDFHLKNPAIEISHTDFQLFNEKGIVKRPFKRLVEPINKKRGLLYPSVCYKNPIGILTVMMSARLLKELKYFDTSLKTMEDQDLWMRIAQKQYLFGYLSTELAYYRSSAGSLSNKTGSYKKAYKVFFNRILKSGDLNYSLLYRQYYRHFGTVYLKKGQYHLSKLYFWKSITLVPLGIVAVSTYIYLVYCLFKSMMKNMGITK